MSEHLRGSGSRGSSAQELRLVLLGNLGCGKTSSADTILGQLSRVSPSAARSCQQRQNFTEGRSVTLVEAPRWYWRRGSMEDSVREETERAFTLAAPGPHAILLLIPVSQFTEMEGRVPAALEEVFGAESLDHTLVLLTCGDYLMGKTVEEYLQKENPGLRQVIERCGGRYHVINNRQRQDREQVRQLLDKVDSMVQQNGVYHRKTVQERDLEQRVTDRRRELMESYRAQKEERREVVSTRTANTETPRSVDRHSVVERERRTERGETDGGVGAGRGSNGLHSTPAAVRESYSAYSQRHDDQQVERTPSFELNAVHRTINSFQETSPEPPPASSPPLPVFSSSPSSPTFASSSSTFPSSSSSSTFPSSSSSSSTFQSSSLSSTYPSSSSSSSSSTLPSSSTSSTYPSSSSSSSSSTLPSSSTSSTYPSSSSSTSSTFPSASSSKFQSSYSSSSSSTFPSSSTSSTSPSSYSSSSHPPSSPRSSSPPELRLVLLGRSGSGKSAAGNSILGHEAFPSHSDSLTSITRECEKKKALVEGRRVAVVDTPDWFNSERTPEEVRAQISSCVALSSPGPHAFLLCVPLDQPAKTEPQALRALESVFGPDAVQRHAVVLFTYADRLRESGKAGDGSVEAYIAGQRGDLLNLVEKCRDRFHVMESGGGERERRSVAELLETVEQTVKEAGGQCYSSPAFQEAENRVRQRQVEIAKEKRGTKQGQEKSRDVGELSSERRLYAYMQPVAEAEEEVREEEIGETRDEAEMSVGAMDIQSLPPITLSSFSPSLLSSIMEKMHSSAKLVPKLLSDGSVWVGDGAKKVKSSQVWGTVGSRAQDVHKMMADSSVWGKMGAGAKHASKLIGDRVPKVVVDSSAWVGSGAKAAAASPMWGKVGSGAKLVADKSMRAGAGLGTGAKSLSQSPMWGKVGSGAKTGAKLVAQNSARVGAGIGAGAKKVAQSPVWGKVGSGAKSGAKMVAASPVWEKIGTTAKQVPLVVILGAVLGLLLGVFLGGAIGGAVGAAAGSAATEVGRRKIGNRSALGKTEDAASSVERRVTDGVDSLVKEGGKVLKTE